MRKIIFGIISILVIFGLVWYFFWQKQMPAVAPGEKTGETFEKAWVEIVNRGVYLVNTDGTLGLELKNGDEVQSGQTIMTDNVGLANLHFSDGSVVRLETQTKVDLKDFVYFSSNKTLKVKIFLQTGRVWSRIKALMTTESYWEVETANAVAAVRGTSFGVVYVPGQTTIIGSVHLVNVNAVNPQTKQLIKNNTAYVGEEQYIKINDQDIAGLLSGVKLSSKIRPYTQAVIKDPWVIKQKELDKEVENQTATTTIVRPKPDKDLTTKPLDNEYVKPTSSINDRPVSSDPTLSQNFDSGSANYSDEDQISDEKTSDSSVQDDFYYSVEDPSETDLSDDSNDYPIGAAPGEVLDSDQTSPDNSSVSPTYNPNTLEKTTTTTIKPTINLRPTNLIR